MELTKEDKDIIKEYKAKHTRKLYYERNLLKEEDQLKRKLEELRIEREIMNNEDYEIPNDIPNNIPNNISNDVKNRLYKSYYICGTCGNKFSCLSALHKHLMLIKGCNLFSDTLTEVDKLISRKIEILELKINSYRLDLETSNTDFTTKKKRLNAMKDSICKIENLLKNHAHLYPEIKRTLLGEFIAEYKKDIKILLFEYYKLIDKSDLFNI